MDFLKGSYILDSHEVNSLISAFGFEGAAKTLSEKADENLDNAYVAGALLMKDIEQKAWPQSKILQEHPTLFHPAFHHYMMTHYEQLEAMLKPERNEGFLYKPLKTLISNYLFKVDGKPVESIQWFWMRLAVQVSLDADGGASLDEVQANYDIFSSWEAIHATPTCVNAGFHRPQLESCFLVPVGDSMASIQEARTLVAMGSKANGGFGLDCGRIRHSRVSNRGMTKGVVGMLKHEFDPLISYADQLGSRPGALTAFLPIWHIDVLDFIRMADRKAPESIRADNLNYSLWVHDLFHQRRLSGGKWTLFCPRETQKLWVTLHGGDTTNSKEVDKAPSLHDMWGKDFDTFYSQCEQHLTGNTMDAADLWEKVCIQRCQIGQPFVMNADASNRKSNQRNQGTITQSNLCVRGDTRILTDKGYQRIDSLVGQKTVIWNGEEWSEVMPAQTGTDQKLLTVTFSNGSEVHCTPYHKFYLSVRKDAIPASELKVGDVLTYWGTPEGNAIVGVTVTSVSDDGGVADTYCFTEPKRHMGIFNGVLAGNCQEILQYTKPGELAATCDLATVNLTRYVQADGTYDWVRLGVVVRQLVRNLNRVLDGTSGIVANEGQKELEHILRTASPDSPEHTLATRMMEHVKKDPTYTARMRNRAIGIGKMGLASTLALMGMEYTSKEASDFATTVCACISWHAMAESAELARVHGSYETFAGSPFSKGILQQDLWDEEDKHMKEVISSLPTNPYLRRYAAPSVEPATFGVSDTWDDLRQKVKGGMRNSLLTCQMPNVTTASVFGLSPSIEPFFSILYATSSKNGYDTTIVDAFRTVMVREGLWEPNILGKYLSEHGGNVAGMHTIFAADQQERCKKVEKLFLRAFDVNKKKYFAMVQRMGRYIDQSQSLNWFFEYPNDKHMAELDTLLWVNGAKNGQYYVHRAAASKGVSTKTMGTPKPEVQVCRKEEGCKWCE